MRRSQAYPSTYLTQDDVREGPILATIKDVRIETIGRGNAPEEKPVMHFRESSLKSFTVNQTNWQTLEDAFGPESDDWTGQRIELYLDPGVKFGLDTVGGVRIRIPTAARGGTLTMDAALALAAKSGKTREDFVAALKAKGFHGYSPAKDSDAARTILAQWRTEADGDLDDTIPF